MTESSNFLKRRWDYAVALVTTYKVIETPLRAAFGYHYASALYIVDLFCAAIFFTDIILHFQTVVHTRGRVLRHPSQIAVYYLKSWFIFDLLGSLPFSLFIQWGMPLHRLWEWAALFRLLRLAKFTSSITAKQTSAFLLRRLAVFLFWVGLIIHLIACGWILLDGVGREGEMYSIYLRSFYWSITTLSTTGYGDIVPQNDSQTLFALLTMLVGTGIYATMIASIASMLTRIDSVRATYQEKMEKLYTFMRYKKLPKELRQKIINYHAYSWERGLGYDEESVLAELPPSLRHSLSMHLNKDLLEKVPFFKKASEAVLKRLIANLQSKVFMPGDYIFHHGETGAAMYFIHHGRVEILNQEGDSLAILDEGGFFGEVALLSNQPRNASARALDFCTLNSLDRHAFDLALQEFPDFADQIKTIARNRQ
ncbi:MAG: ion transporter [Verrucomicrobiota bacterium]